MKRIQLLLLPAAAGCLVAFKGAPDTFQRQLAQQLARFYQVAAPEKVYLHFDKDTYVAGETIWFKAYAVDAARHRPDSLSGVLYVDLLDAGQQVLSHQVLRLQNGTAPGDFVLPTALPQGMYTVRAYTNWMRNTPDFVFRRALPVWSEAPAPASKTLSAAARPDVQFFPEGGTLVAGLPATIGVKAVGSDGRGQEVSGTVLDTQGKVVARFSTQHAGMGHFELQPVAGQRYTAQVQLPSGPPLTYPLPVAEPQGLALHVESTGNAYRLVVRRMAGAGAAAEQLTVAAHVRGQVAYLEQGTVTTETPFTATIPKSRFATGVVHFTVFDGQRVARCERLAFADATPGGLRLTVQASKQVYRPRERVELRVTAQNAAGQLQAGSFSLAVTNAELAPPSAGAPDIRSYLLLTSDLHGEVENPGYYFASGTTATAQALDNLLLTQGWRRFTWQPLLADQLGSFPYVLEKELSLRGRVVNNRQQPAAAVPVVLTPQQGSSRQLTTDTEGRFAFMGFTGYDSTVVKLEALTTKQVRRPQILLDIAQPDLPGTAASLLHPFPEPGAVPAERLRQAKALKDAAPVVTPRGILLSNVTIQGAQGPMKPDTRRIYSRADAVIQTRNITGLSTYRDVVQVLQGRVAGLSVVANQGFVQVTMRGNTTSSTQQLRLAPAPTARPNTRYRTPAAEATPISSTPLFLLDGVATDINMINSIPVNDFESIEVIRTNSAAIFGERAAAGAIAFFTKQANPNYNPSLENQAVVTPPLYRQPRFYQARTFYEPVYSNATTSASDPRGTTLYWNPTIQTDASGQATVSFYCGDKAGLFQVAVEGVSRTGQPARAVGTLQVREIK
ncbi:TonB-dependent receptor plug domain-containing protein [Hymenobacter sp. HSC-4F20]|uniref:TonB-dependent receptor plug domain-containing protein n=1 Tax=Hymenobacter sp. HSC-4F20 TaxID=2864135 RepID=UPI001C738059|nr:TonB-dependent receptor plug domain-containing protein [Hymenobacter sp. HSC-4F20]MBX0291408.1 TonB-dependent receptor plug domain-containing protein [Hymenobacter sp. HSC-4F20]